MSAVPSSPEGLAAILRELVDLSRTPTAPESCPGRGDKTASLSDTGNSATDHPVEKRTAEGSEFGTV
jgi:hypothetical protein